jgi:hypothetical protein
MERREERLEKCREPIGFHFKSGRGAMQTRAPPICLFELVAKKSIACERAINQVALCMFQWSSRDELSPSMVNSALIQFAGREEPDP